MPEHRATIEYEGHRYHRTVITGRNYDPRPVAFLLGGMAVVKKSGDVWLVDNWIMRPNATGGGPMTHGRCVRFWAGDFMASK